MKVVILNGPDECKDAVMVRAGDRWPSRKPRKIFKDTVIHPYPMWLAYTASVLREAGITPLYLDAIHERLTVEETIEKIRQMTPDIAVIETATPSIDVDLKTTRRIKEELGIPTVLIDIHATVFHKELIKEPYVDFIVRGEFEMGVKEIATTLRDKGDFNQVTGITYKQNGKVVINPDRPLIADLDTLPYPDRDLIDQRNYRQELCLREPYFLLFGSRGCPFHCIFCLWIGPLWRGKVRLRQIPKIVDEVEYLQKKYGAREIFFYDDTLNVSIKRVMDLCNEILNRGIKIEWTCNLRVDQTSREMIQLMKKAGCRLAAIGVESGSQWMLDNVVDKKITLDQVRNTVKWVKEAGIIAHCDFVVGLPGETKKTLMETYNFIKELKPDALQIGMCTPYPGTRFYEQVKDQIRDWGDFDGSSGRSFCEISTDELKNAVHRIYLEFYFSPRMIIKKLFSLRSWDDVKAFWKQMKSFIGRYLTFGKIPQKI